MPRKEKLPTSLFTNNELEFEMDNQNDDIYGLSKEELHAKVQREKLLRLKTDELKDKVVNALDQLYNELAQGKHRGQVWTTKNHHWLVLQIDSIQTWDELVTFLQKMELGFLV